MSYLIIALINATAFMSTRHITNPNQFISMRPHMMANPTYDMIFRIAKIVHAILYVIIIILWNQTCGLVYSLASFSCSIPISGLIYFIQD